MRAGEPGAVLWFTGLSGAGKSTIAAGVHRILDGLGIASELLDGDAIRAISPTGFTREDREAHVRRVGFLASRLEHHGVTVSCALISPYAASRDWVRGTCRQFVEIHVATPLSECERRDVKGLYRRARRGEIVHFTGIDDPYEPPTHADLTVNTLVTPVDSAVDQVLSLWTQITGVDLDAIRRSQH